MDNLHPLSMSSVFLGSSNTFKEVFRVAFDEWYVFTIVTAYHRYFVIRFRGIFRLYFFSVQCVYLNLGI